MEEIKDPTATAVVQPDLLDMVLVVTENIKLLIVGPLIAGLLALGIGFLWSRTYQSVTVLQADQLIASLMTTAVVLDPVVTALGLAKADTPEEARVLLRENIKTVIGRNDKLLTLTVSASTALQAQSIAAAVLQQTFRESRPKGSVRSRLEVLLVEAQTRLKQAQEASEGVLKRLDSSASSLNGGSELARGYAELLTATGAAQNQIIVLEGQLEGVSSAQVVQPPTLPQKPSHPKKALIAIGVTLATELALLLFIFMRMALGQAKTKPASSAKMLRIRHSLGLK